VLVVWKVDRLARNVEDHFAIKAALRRFGVAVASVTEPIAADANGRLLETILAGFAAFDKDVRALRSVHGLRQKLKEGIWPWKPPLGYLPPKLGRKTQPDRPDPSRFDGLKRAWQLFATGAYRQSEIRSLLGRWGVLGHRDKSLTPQTIARMFLNPYYKGILRDTSSHEELRGRHVAMVTEFEFACVQQVLGRGVTRRTRAILNPHFPLRGFVRCPTCQNRMTAAFAKGRSHRYGYYNCSARSCSTRTRSYRADHVHREFEEFVGTLHVPRDRTSALLDCVRAVVNDTSASLKRMNENVVSDLRRVEREHRELLSLRAQRLITDAEFVSHRDFILKRRYDLQATLAQTTDWRLSDADQTELIEVLDNVGSLWADVSIEQQRGFEELLIPEGYVFGAIRTATIGLLFRDIVSAPQSTKAHTADATR